MSSKAATKALPPGSVIGILGGGQLGRMLALSAAKLGFICHIYAPPGDNPAFDVAARHTAADYDDKAALTQFAKDIDVVTYEFENIPDECLEFLKKTLPVRPSVEVLSTTQDRIDEKQMALALGIKVPEFVAVSSLEELQKAVEIIGRPCVLKTRRFGYDGKGQTIIKPGSDLAQSFAEIGEKPAILEAFVPFEMEVSVIAARDIAGNMAVYDIPENRHENHILRTSHMPANISDKTCQQASKIAHLLAEKMDYVGVFAVELFVVGTGPDEYLMLNEIAPRVHNSGHWTSDACQVSQFEQHIRAISGLPLGSPERHSDAIMYNLLGTEAADITDLAMQEGMSIHLYGKKSSREGRKMGHVTKLSSKDSAPNMPNTDKTT